MSQKCTLTFRLKEDLPENGVFRFTLFAVSVTIHLTIHFYSRLVNCFIVLHLLISTHQKPKADIN